MVRLRVFGLVAMAIVTVGCAEEEDDRPSVIACGVLGGADTDRVWGWAQVVDEAPVTVRIDVDGVVAAEVIADQPREDLVVKGIHPTGQAGFSVTVPGLAEGAEVRAFVDQVPLELTRSPLSAGPSSPSTSGGGSTTPTQPLGWCSASSWGG